LRPIGATWRTLRASCALNKTSLVDAGERDLSAFVRDLHERGMSAATVSRRLSALRRFFRFQLGDNERQDNPTSRLDGPAFRRDPPDVLSRDEVARLIEAAQGTEPSDLRTMCLVELLYGAGLRASECCDLPLSALPAPGATVLIVRGKGDKERITPLGKPALLALKNYLAVRDQFFPKSAVRSVAQRFVFPSRGAGGRLTRRRLADARRPRDEGRNYAGAGDAARAAPCLRDASAVGRGGPACGAAAAGSRRYRDDADLYACRDG